MENRSTTLTPLRPSRPANPPSTEELKHISKSETWPLPSSGALPNISPINEAIKRVIDVLISLSLIILLSPLFGIVSLLIILDSPGAPIFRQRRKGKNQVAFFMYKFRTMHKHAHRERLQLTDQNEVDGIIFKLREDPRITRVGRFLREYSIDEFPQLFNVLKGEMSLVGPRPFPMEDFRTDLGPDPTFQRWLSERHLILPGLTGLWQVSGRNDLPFRELMRLDLKYVRTANPVADLIILCRTLWVVVNKKGAY